MNIGSVSPQPRPFHRSAPKSEQSTQLSFDNVERRMQHTSFQRVNLTQHFWDMADNLPRENQVNLAASVVVGQLLQNGKLPENKTFLEGMKSRFGDQELDQLKASISSHPLLKGRPQQEIDSWLNQVNQLFQKDDPLKAVETTPMQQRPTRLPSPDNIFFQTTFLQQGAPGGHSGTGLAGQHPYQQLPANGYNTAVSPRTYAVL